MKRLLSGLLRGLGVLQASDYTRFLFLRLKNNKKNRLFRENNPDIELPPDYLMYESFKLDYSSYYDNGRKTAEWLINLAEKHMDLTGKTVLDWGCGPARLVRHLPELVQHATCFGTDYNERSIRWCQDHLPAIDFRINGLMPPLSFEDQSFNMVYGISIFTHLSEPAHKAWIKELHRVLSPGGILVLTLHGHSFRMKLNEEERNRFDEGRLVVRGQVKEGHRTYTTFHPERWVRSWASEFTVAEHIPGAPGVQDTWIFRLEDNHPGGS